MKLITKLVAISSLLVVMAGCGSAQMIKFDYNAEGKLISVSEIKCDKVGSGKFKRLITIGKLVGAGVAGAAAAN